MTESYDASEELLMLTVEPGQMEATLRALADAGMVRTSGQSTGTSCSKSGPGWTCGDRDQDQT
ncbi:MULTISPECIES: hypothetical protein [unclassified Streptomyces]|uniref:hypothetical protein n=1 Tax=unclassified Streptomyces TaxID=2593676 RepID=UPI001CBD3D50|nr:MULTISPECIES: hypothetical protein [unclassified Streptomyces]WPO70067.1 hypothetical protein R9806_05210 [Streptomyces sp. KN37]